MEYCLYVPGVWDTLHEGHIRLLKRAKAMCQRLVVGVVSDEGAVAYKRRPLFDERHRLSVVRELGFVDFALIQRTTDPTPELEVVRPDALVHGSDWDRLKQGQETLARLGIRYVSLPYTDGISSSAIINGLRERFSHEI
jgi:cytidyltransferase-like protein